MKIENGVKVVFVDPCHSSMVCEYGDGCELVGEVRVATAKEITQGYREHEPQMNGGW